MSTLPSYLRIDIDQGQTQRRENKSSTIDGLKGRKTTPCNHREHLHLEDLARGKRASPSTQTERKWDRRRGTRQRSSQRRQAEYLHFAVVLWQKKIREEITSNITETPKLLVSKPQQTKITMEALAERIETPKVSTRSKTRYVLFAASCPQGSRLTEINQSRIRRKSIENHQETPPRLSIDAEKPQPSHHSPPNSSKPTRKATVGEERYKGNKEKKTPPTVSS